MKFKIRFIHIIILLLINYGVKAQVDKHCYAKNIVYLEVLGYGGYASLNYERLIPLQNQFKIGARIGVTSYHLKDYTNKFNPDIILPIGINGLFGKHHQLVLGLGQTISSTTQLSHSSWELERKTKFHANFTIGYRYQKRTGGFTFACAYTPIIEFYKYYRHWAGFSIGYAF